MGESVQCTGLCVYCAAYCPPDSGKQPLLGKVTVGRWCWPIRSRMIRGGRQRVSRPNINARPLLLVVWGRRAHPVDQSMRACASAPVESMMVGIICRTVVRGLYFIVGLE